MHTQIALLIFFLIFDHTYSLKSTPPEDLDPLEEYRRNLIFPLKYLILCAGIVIACVIRHLVHHFDVPMPYAVFTIMTGILWGTVSLYNPSMGRVTTLIIEMMDDFQYIYLPVIIFSISFCIDVHSFFRSFWQIMVIGGPVACMSGMVTGLSIRVVISDDWSRADALLLGSILICNYPMHAVRFLKETSMQNKHLRTLLHGETLVTTAWSFALYTLLIHHIMGYVVRPEQFVMNIIRQLCLGVPLGYFWGVVGTSLMQMAYGDALGLTLSTISIAFTSFYYTDWISNAGILGTLVAGVMMASKRSSLSHEMNKILINHWFLFSNLFTDLLCLYVGIEFPSVLVKYLDFKDYALVLVTYLASNILRFMSFLLFTPILSRLGYGMSSQSMVFCVWVGIKNPISLAMALGLSSTAYYNDSRKARIFVLHVMMVYLLMMFINGSCFKWLVNALRMSDISVSRQINMNNCMKFIHEARSKTVSILKMDRFVADANWPLVIQTTNMKHPYKKKHVDFSDQAEENLLGYKYTYCPDCQTNILNEPTPRELKEMTKEAKLRVLKLKKSAYSRLFENGMVSKKGIRSLQQAVNVAMDSEELVIELDGLFKLFEKEGIFYRFLRNVAQLFFKDKYERVRPPRLRWRLICYRVMKHDAFFIILNLLVLCHFIILTNHVAAKFNHKRGYEIVFNLNFEFFECVFYLFVLVYLLEFFMKVFALSWIYFFRHGVSNYFRSYTNVLDFTILCLCLLCVFVHSVILIHRPNVDLHIFFLVMDTTVDIFLALRAIRVLTFIRFCAFYKDPTPTIMKYLESKIDRHRAMAFEIGKNYIAGQEEILQNIEQIVDQDQIREVIKAKLQQDRLSVTRRLGIAQKESPQVAQTVKTKLVMRTVLSAMRQDAMELKAAGWLDEVEYMELLKSMEDREAFIDSIKQIEPPSSKLIFREMGYMGDDEQLFKFLHSNVTTKKFAPGEVVLGEGSIVSNIYILITGMLKITYTPSSIVLINLTEHGLCPIVDYLISINYDEPLCDYILPGTTVGEKGLLTGRPYDGVVTAETVSQVYVLTKTVIDQALEMKNDPVTGFDCLLWKYMSQDQALLIMMNTSSYQTCTQDKIKYLIEKSFSPDLSNFKCFLVNQMIAEVILIEGVVVDVNSRTVYTAPSYIPRSVQKLFFPKSSTVKIDTLTETRLLIIPSKDYNEYEIMLNQEEICDLVDADSKKCLWRYIEDMDLWNSENPKIVKLLERVSRYRRTPGSSKSLSNIMIP